MSENIHIRNEKEISLEEAVVSLLKEKNLTVTTAESCTAGLVAARIMNVAGASYVYSEGYITYSDDAKRKLLGVRKETLEKYTAVSEETALEMAAGAAKSAGADAAISVTGIAGPGGGTEEKPVGLIYIGCFLRGEMTVKECHFEGDRMENRTAAAGEALQLLKQQLMTE
ncbi:MAG: CinA family protein [Eubacteriales bacterium]|nr:CinA family protein [Eubacteriales bacterium]